MRRVLYLVPGAGESAAGSRYAGIRQAFARAGFVVVPVRIRWGKIAGGWRHEYARAVEHAVLRERHEAVLLGFSWGAIAALVAARRIKPSALILCSLSPWFAEDRFFVQQFLAERGLTRWYTQEMDMDLCALSFAPLACLIHARTFLLYGAKEDQVVVWRSYAAAAAIRHSRLIAVPGAGHAIMHSAYVRELGKIAASFSIQQA